MLRQNYYKLVPFLRAHIYVNYLSTLNPQLKQNKGLFAHCKKCEWILNMLKKCNNFGSSHCLLLQFMYKLSVSFYFKKNSAMLLDIQSFYPSKPPGRLPGNLAFCFL
jgi:hypothetical protein